MSESRIVEVVAKPLIHEVEESRDVSWVCSRCSDFFVCLFKWLFIVVVVVVLDFFVCLNVDELSSCPFVVIDWILFGFRVFVVCTNALDEEKPSEFVIVGPFELIFDERFETVQNVVEWPLTRFDGVETNVELEFETFGVDEEENEDDEGQDPSTFDWDPSSHGSDTVRKSKEKLNSFYDRDFLQTFFTT